MRSLTEAEGRVIGTLLGGQHRTDRGGYTAAGVPRTTFQVVRQRAFDSGWIREGYIPNPAVFGGAKLDFRLRQPFAEEWVSDTRSGTSPGTLTVWGSPELILTVTLLRGKEAELGEESRVIDNSAWEVRLTTDSASVLCYFDFEGAWSALGAGMPSRVYPRSFPVLNLPPRFRSSRGLTVVEREVVGLLSRPASGGGPVEPRRGFSFARLPRKLRRLFDYGAVDRRVIPDFRVVPPWHENRVATHTFVSGKFRAGSSSTGLFQDLIHGARVHPYLYASDKNTVLMAAVGLGVPLKSHAREKPLNVLIAHLDDIVVRRAPASGFSQIVTPPHWQH
jgi:hypothetical protein